MARSVLAAAWQFCLAWQFCCTSPLPLGGFAVAGLATDASVPIADALRPRSGSGLYTSLEWQRRRCQGCRANNLPCGSNIPLGLKAVEGPAVMRLCGGWDKGIQGEGWGPGGNGAAAEGPYRSLATTGHTHMSYYGFMFDVRGTYGLPSATQLSRFPVLSRPLHRLHQCAVMLKSCHL